MPVPMLYAEVPRVRLRQVLLDAGVALWVVVWTWVARGLYELVERLEGPGRSLEDAGTRIAGWRVPLLDRRLGPITSGGEAIQRAGTAQQDAVHTLALWLGVLVAVGPILWLLARYLPGRVRWAREATAASRIRAEGPALQLFALRALTNRPLVQLRRTGPDPAGDYERGDFEALANLELTELGLRPNARSGQA